MRVREWVLVGCLAGTLGAQAPGIRFQVQIPDPEKPEVTVEMEVPSGRRELDLRLPVWSPGFYRVEGYADEVLGLEGWSGDGNRLAVSHPAPNRWVVRTAVGKPSKVTYRLRCTGSTVTRNTVKPTFAVLTGPATFLGLQGAAAEPCEVVVTLPKGWKQVVTALDPLAGSNRFRAGSYDELLDSPLLMGNPAVHEFKVGGVPHALAEVEAPSTWDGGRAARDLQRILEGSLPLWGGKLPYPRYYFLSVFRPGGGGLEHLNSALVTTHPGRIGSEGGYEGWLRFMAHEYVHAFNVKRLRPVELGPFDYERPPVTSSLWVSEGLTSYVADLLVARAGIGGEAGFRQSLSKQIEALQASPGRLKQSLAQSSREVWNNSLSGVNVAPDTVSYYIKGQVVGFLLDAEIQRMSGGKRSLEWAMTRACQLYGGERGFTAAEFQAVLEQAAGGSLKAWLTQAIEVAGELDYAPALRWYGLRMETPEAPRGVALVRDPAATPEQRARWEALLTSPTR